MDIAKDVLTIVSEKSGKDEVSINDRFQEDLGIDSLTVVEITMEVEMLFGIDLKDEEWKPWRKVSDIVDCVKTRLGVKPQ